MPLGDLPEVYAQGEAGLAPTTAPLMENATPQQGQYFVTAAMTVVVVKRLGTDQTV